MLATITAALAAHGVPGGVGVVVDHPGGTGVIAPGETTGQRWTARVVLEAMGVTGIREDAHGFLRGVLPKGAPLRPASDPGTLGTPPPEPVKVCGCGAEIPAASRSRQCRQCAYRQCAYRQWRKNHPPKRRRAR